MHRSTHYRSGNQPRQIATRHRAQKQSGRADIFRFRFDRAPLTPQGWFGERDSRDAGAFHAGELLYVFDNLDAFPWLHEDADRELAKLASSYWINFVRNGDPNGPAQWPVLCGQPIAGDLRGRKLCQKHLDRREEV